MILVIAFKYNFCFSSTLSSLPTTHKNLYLNTTFVSLQPSN